MTDPQIEIVHKGHEVYAQITDGAHTVRERFGRHILKMNADQQAFEFQMIAYKLRKKLLRVQNAEKTPLPLVENRSFQAMKKA